MTIASIKQLGSPGFCKHVYTALGWIAWSLGVGREGSNGEGRLGMDLTDDLMSLPKG